MAIPHPQALHLELRSLHTVYLVLPTSAETRDVYRFQAYQGSDTLGRLEFEQMLDTMRQGGTPFFSHPGNLAAIRRFYAAWRNERQEVPRALLIRQLQEDVRQGALAVFRFVRDPHRSMIRGDAGSGILPGRGPVSGWSGGQKVVAMFEAIPEYLTEAARAEFEAFLTPQNLAVMALFFGGIAVVQAVPGADAIVDGMIAGLAWWQFGWAGLIAGKDFAEAVVKAGHARTEDDIKLAAKLAAAALVSLGLLVLLREIVKRVHEVKPKAPEAEDEPLPPKSPRQQVLAAYQERKTSPATWSKFENLKNVKTGAMTDSDQSAYDALQKLGYSETDARQVINSGGNFTPRPVVDGETMYKIGSDGYAPSPNSAYYLDQNGFNDVMSKYRNPSTGELNSAGIKIYLALPCANQANAIYQGVVSTGGTGQSATIGPAFENFALTHPDGSITNGMLMLDGGGTQVTPPAGAITSLIKVSP